MAWTSGFFNSVNGDRTYHAAQLSEMFEGLITNGVFEQFGDKLAVSPYIGNGLGVQIASGKGYFAGKWVLNDAPYILNLEAADVLLDRYCAVCVRVDLSNSGRTAEPFLKYGDFATSPVKPEMERSENVKEFCLAYVYIRAGATAITAGDVEDTRFLNSVCGWVTGLIDQLNTETLYTQWEYLFTSWLSGLEDYLDENVEAKLVADIQELKTERSVVTGLVSADDWQASDDNSYYTQEVAAPGVTPTSAVFVMPKDGYDGVYLDMDCDLYSCNEGSITLIARNLQNTTMNIDIIVMN